MDVDTLLERIARGRTDLVVELLSRDDWRDSLGKGRIRPLQWLVYYGDLTAIKMVIAAGGDLSSISLDEELGNAAFFGHWKICDFLAGQGADVNATVGEAGETALHNALAKAGRPHYLYTVRVLVERGADVNARTAPGRETGAFMRDVRTCGETPLHRAAAYADAETIRFLLERGADREARDAHGNSPLTWASVHLRPGAILKLLEFGEHRVGERTVRQMTSDHGAGWGNGMEWKLLGDYLPDD